MKELCDEYDAQAISAAALPMVYVRDCLNWMKWVWDVPQDSYTKPVDKGRRGQGRSSRKGGNYNKSKSASRTTPQVRSGVIIEQ